jgi:hypothetical protein
MNSIFKVIKNNIFNIPIGSKIEYRLIQLEPTTFTFAYSTWFKDKDTYNGKRFTKEEFESIKDSITNIILTDDGFELEYKQTYYFFFIHMKYFKSTYSKNPPYNKPFTIYSQVVQKNTNYSEQQGYFRFSTSENAIKFLEELKDNALNF